ncbi:hypothetical protein BGZ68_006263 [Mortierella alpina]|nr:hypothetical protein BGZ68_006263 [Mortierella alpina]
MPVKTTTLATEPVLVQQHELVVTLVDPANQDNKSAAKTSAFSAIILTYGATLTRLQYPDRWNQPQDVVLGFDNWEDYLAQAKPGGLNPYFGAIVGRTASRWKQNKYADTDFLWDARIGHASFTLQSNYVSELAHDVQGIKYAQSVSESTGPPHTPGTTKPQIQTQNQAQARYQEYEPKHTLEISNGVDCHHGGPVGFDKQHWTTVDVQQEDPSVTLQLISPHGQGGYPGRVVTKVQYRLTSLGELIVEYWAELEAEVRDEDNVDDLRAQEVLDLHSTIVSLTNHTYWNLDGVLNPTDSSDEKAAETTLEGLIKDDAFEGQGQQQQEEKEEVVTLRNHLSVKNHTLWLSSRDIIELGTSHPVPTGQIIDVSSSSKEQAELLDFTGHIPGSDLGLNRLGPGLDRIPNGYGYDHVYALSPPKALSHSSTSVCDIGIQGYYPCTPHVATLYSPQTGIRLDLMTSEPALVLYAAGYLDHKLLPRTKSKDLDMPLPLMISPSATPLQSPAHRESTHVTNENQQQQEQTRKRGIRIVAEMDKFAGISLEPIRYPDAIHHQNWAKMVTLHHDQMYRQRSVYKFRVAD